MESTTPRLRDLSVVLFGALLSVLLLAGCRQSPPEVVVSSSPPGETPLATGQDEATAAPAEDATPAADDAWTAVQQRGRLIVGTSADYPPFATYTEDFQLTGYDVALARLIGERLGVEVEFNDMAFDGLGGALQVGQIDAAIAAISITDERRQSADFSNLYFVSEGAALARAGEGIQIDSIEDLAPYRVAVQDGSVYQTWLEEEAVATGLLPADHLLAYVEAGQAVTDLRAGLVDVAIADLLPLEVAARDEGLEIAGQGLNRQRFAVALARGSTLLSPINEALFDLQNEGELARLAEEYLNLEDDELAPLPEPEASTPEAPTLEAPAETGRAPECVNAMTLIAHLSLDDDNMRSPPPVNPGTPFQKSWRIQNNGTCTWGEGYLLTPVGGNVPQATMGGAPTPVAGPVVPGQTVDVTVDLVAPLAPGVYQGFWSMRAPNGLLFGERIWVGITVPALPTATPPPTATASPTITFTVDRTSIRAGECVTFTWDVSGGGTVYFAAQGQAWQQNQVAPSAGQAECPQTTTTYDLRVVSPGGSIEVRSIRIDVQPVLNAPLIEAFSVTPSHQIVAGQCIEVRWRISGDVDNVRVARNETTLWNGAPLSGTSRDCPPAGQYAYSIEATGPGGASRALENVSVLAATPGPGTPTATPPVGQVPVIVSFGVLPSQILVGSCVTVSWSVGGSVDRVQLRRDGVLVLDFALLNGSVTDCLNAEGMYEYRIDATNAQGGFASQAATVVVVR
jgi:polar amino acid transport system substrate-binding protein